MPSPIRRAAPAIAAFALALAALGAATWQARRELAPDGVLTDDAYIFLRYARNLAGGLGWVWNPGEERVEGTTSPL